ncbi:MAG: glycosyltransferase family 4 protein [Leucobacter sp.]
MRIAIATRIFEPEPSAASFRLAGLARTLSEAGHEVTVFTVRPSSSAGHPATEDGDRPYRVRRVPVMRDASGYVRGYLQYLSFDVPLFFRLMFTRRFDLLVVEPPPTTGFFARVAMALKRTPYAYYAADIWSDAAGQTGAGSFVISAVRAVERFVWRGARTVLSVSQGVTTRLGELGALSNVVTIGNGVDVQRFQRSLQENPEPEVPIESAFVYAGTASEWHGASIFIEAYAKAGASVQGKPLIFIGSGSERHKLQEQARSFGVAHNVSFRESLPAEQLAPWLAHSVAALASLRPGAGYDFAFPTKLYSAAACGAPLIHVGPGPAVDFVQTQADGEAIGYAVPYDRAAVSEALIQAAESFSATNGAPERRERVRNWAAREVSIEAVADRALAALTTHQGAGR